MNIRKNKNKEFAKYYAKYKNVKKASHLADFSFAEIKNGVGYDLLRQDYIKEEIRKYDKDFEIKDNDVLKIFKSLATFDVLDYYNVVYILKTNNTFLSKYLGSRITEAKYSTLTEKQKSFYKMNLMLKPLAQLSKEQRQAIKQISTNKNGDVELEFVSKEKSLEILAKYLGLFEKHNSQKQIYKNFEEFYNV